jgi:hypothetical protein
MTERQPLFVGMVRNGKNPKHFSLGLILGEEEVSWEVSPETFDSVQRWFIAWGAHNNISSETTFLVGADAGKDKLFLNNYWGLALAWLGFIFPDYVDIRRLYWELTRGRDDWKAQVESVCELASELKIDCTGEPITGIGIARTVKEVFESLTEGVFFEEV